MLTPLTIRLHCAHRSVFTGKLRFARATRQTTYRDIRVEVTKWLV